MSKWNPRGEPTWPDFNQAKPGQRVAHVRTGYTGTFFRWPKTGNRNPGYATIKWDNGVTGTVVAYAYDLRPIA